MYTITVTHARERAQGINRERETYDPDRGWRFSTYATWWVRQAVQRALADKGRRIRVPVHMGDKIRKMARAYNELSSEMERKPTDEEVARTPRVD
jgi:RNA polymerase primary sigma factor